ncbi:flavodoxin [Ornithinibacillus sp. L9]|uniref:Flavodoxin n=1 Tax=Ornithinibacillus caprae TaxID=2678566 RepID=A0A6N8FLY5_9BACI|nr:flavodoxin [Ornithinibacillus caprae]MUK89007.1 flavodoxin [Ornithinibacillus caprae]
MGRFLILYTSSTGNTEIMTKVMETYLQERKHEVVMKHFEYDRIDVEELLGYDVILVGTYTWDDGEIPYEVEDFYDELDDIDLSGVHCGVFGSGDTFYDEFCGAVDLMAERLMERGAVVMRERLKVDLEPDREDVKRCERFVANGCQVVKPSDAS